MVTRIVVCGLGKLGSPIAASFAKAGLEVVGYDLDVKKIEAINAGQAPVSEPGLFEAIQLAGPRLTATADAFEATQETRACIFVAPTPSLPNGSFDNSYLLAGIEKISKAVGDRKYLFIIASTVTPGSCEHVLLPAIRANCPRGQIVYKPELIALGTVMRDLSEPDLAIFGGDRPSNIEAFELYCSIHAGLRSMSIPDTALAMTLIEAELAKIALNCAITMKISFANQVGMVAQQLGANPQMVLNAVGSDSRIGGKALKPGMPFGGPCFPRDCRMFQYVAEQVSVVPHLAMATDKVNENVLQYILDSVPSDGEIGILGLAYKAGTMFTEDAAGQRLFKELTAAGRSVCVHDPLVSPDGMEKILRCRTVIVTMDAPEYRDLRFPNSTFLIDPFYVTKTSREMFSTTKTSREMFEGQFL